MSMIDCSVHVEKKPDPKGDRVVLTFECVFLASLFRCVPNTRVDSGKFLPYAKW